MNIIEELSTIMHVWPSQTTPESNDYDSVAFEYTTGNCWDVVKWMSDIRHEFSLSIVCCFNTNWGLAGTNLHCVVDSSGPHWFNDAREMIPVIKDMVGQ